MLQSVLPGNVHELQRCEFGNGDTGAFENMARFGSSQSEPGEFIADVGDFNIVGNDVVVEQLQHFFALPAFRIDEERVAPLENVEGRLDAALRIEQKGVDSAAGGKIANVIRRHSVQPADAVAAVHRDLGARTQVIEAAVRQQCLEL